MLCLNNAAWCKGPTGHGARCLVCQNSGGAGPSRLAGTSQQPGTSQQAGTRPRPVVPVKPAHLLAHQAQQAQQVQQTQQTLQLIRPASPEQGNAADEPDGYLFYRGDTRPPADLRNLGFAARTPLSIPQARALVDRYMGKSSGTITLPGTANALQEATNRADGLKLIDLVREFKREKSNNTVQISTDLTEECGGYTNGYVYRIELHGLNLMTRRNVVTVNPTSLRCDSVVNCYVVLDTGSIDTATTIGISSKGDEVSFVTSIPYSAIKAYKAPNSTTWQDMP